MIAKRKVARQFEGGLADQPTVQIERGPVVLELTQSGANAAVLQSQPQADGLAVGDVDPERRRSAGPADDRRWQRTCPVVAVVCGECGDALVLGGGWHAEGVEHGDQRRVDDARVLAGPVHVLGCNAMKARQLDQRARQVSHPAHLARFSRHRGSTGRPRCPCEPPAGRFRCARRPPAPGGPRCTGWTSCSSTPR